MVILDNLYIYKYHVGDVSKYLRVDYHPQHVMCSPELPSQGLVP